LPNSSAAAPPVSRHARLLAKQRQRGHGQRRCLIKEPAALADHAQFNKRRAIVIAGRIGNLETTQVDGAQISHSIDQRFPGQIAAGLLQAFNQHLGGDIALE
jgi:hypothetical protein